LSWLQRWKDLRPLAVTLATLLLFFLPNYLGPPLVLACVYPALYGLARARIRRGCSADARRTWLIAVRKKSPRAQAGGSRSCVRKIRTAIRSSCSSRAR